MTKKILILLLLVCTVGAVYPTDYYVSPVGDNADTGLATGNAWLTIDYAIRQLVPGDTLYIMAGTYNEWIGGDDQSEYASGTVTDPIEITAYGDGEVIIDGTGIDLSTDEYGLIYLNEEEYYIYSELTVQNVDIQIDDQAGLMCGNHCIIRNCTFKNSGDAGPFAWNVNDILVEDCYVEFTNGDAYGAIRIQGVDGFVVRNNIVVSDEGNGIYLKGSNGEVYGNDVTGSGTGISLAALNDSVIYQNHVRECGLVGLRMVVPDGQTGSNLDIYNNLIYNTGRNGMQIMQYTGNDGRMDNVKIINNTIYNCVNNGIRNMRDPGDMVGGVIRNNIISNNGMTGPAWNFGQIIFDKQALAPDLSIEYNIKYGDQSSGAEIDGTNLTIEDPDNTFIDAADGDFHLKAGSAAFNGGVSTDAPADDYEGNARPLFTDYDIGAYELNYNVIADCSASSADGYEYVVEIDGAGVDTSISGEILPDAGTYSLSATWTQTACDEWNGASWVTVAGTATIPTPTSLTNDIDFSAGGTAANPYRYTLTLTLDQDTGVTDTLEIIVYAEMSAITVDAGTNQTVTLPDAATLAGVLTPGGELGTWSKESGPGDVTFTPGAGTLDADASFDEAGVYVLRLTSQTNPLLYSDVTITVNPYPDTDNDGIPDVWEMSWSGITLLSELGDSGTGGTGSIEDYDNDGITDYDEYMSTFDLSPVLDDSDSDGMKDGWELTYYTGAGWDPGVSDEGNSMYDNDQDPDKDGLINSLESNLDTSPVSQDTDGDTMGDAWEYTYMDGSGWDPAVSDVGNGLYDPDANFDGDPYTNFEEYQNNTDPTVKDKKKGGGGGGCSHSENAGDGFDWVLIVLGLFTIIRGTLVKMPN